MLVITTTTIIRTIIIIIIIIITIGTTGTITITTTIIKITITTIIITKIAQLDGDNVVVVDLMDQNVVLKVLVNKLTNGILNVNKENLNKKLSINVNICNYIKIKIL